MLWITRLILGFVAFVQQPCSIITRFRQLVKFSDKIYRDTPIFYEKGERSVKRPPFQLSVISCINQKRGTVLQYPLFLCQSAATAGASLYIDYALVSFFHLSLCKGGTLPSVSAFAVSGRQITVYPAGFIAIRTAFISSTMISPEGY